MVHSKNKGNAFEQKIARLFRKKGWPKCATARYASKEIDDLKVDLVRTSPYNVQCKAVETLGSPHKTLKEMPDKGINLVFHKRNRMGVIVAMSMDDFFKIIKK